MDLVRSMSGLFPEAQNGDREMLASQWNTWQLHAFTHFTYSIACTSAHKRSIRHSREWEASDANRLRADGPTMSLEIERDAVDG